MTVVEGVGAICLCNVCTAVTVRVDLGRALDCVSAEGATIIVWTLFRVEDDVELVVLLEDAVENVGSAMQMASPADELVTTLEVATLLEVLSLESGIDDVDVEYDDIERDDRSEHHGRVEVEAEVDGGARMSSAIPVAILMISSV